MTAKAHSLFSASGAERWLQCPGSIALCATQPPSPDSAYAREGTAAHALAERCLLGGVDPVSCVGKQLTIDKQKITVTQEMADAVKVYTDEVRKLQEDGDELFVEREFHLVDFDEDFWGTNDASLRKKSGHLYVFDYKHGAGVPVQVEGNRQLMYYALGALYAAGPGIHTVVLVIVQPRCAVGGDPVRTWEIDAISLVEYGFELAAAAVVARQPDAPLNPGKWCRWCAANGVCPKLYESAQEAAQHEFEDARLAEDNNASLSPEELGRRLELAERLKAWISAVNSYAYNEALRGRMPEGRKFVAKRGRRAWLNGVLAMNKAVKTFKVDEDDLYESKPVSPAAFEKIVGKAKAKNFLAEHAETKSSGFALVALSDKREALTVEALSEFEPIEDDSDG